MTDKELVLKYIKNMYQLKGDVIYSKYTNENITKQNFINQIIKVFGNINIENDNFSDWITDWIKLENIKAYNDVLDYLNYKCLIKLGPINWLITDIRGKNFDIDCLKKYFKGKYSDTYLSQVFDNWVEEQIIKKCEKIIF